MPLPKSPEQKRATRAARQARYRQNLKRKEALNQHIDHSAGVGPAPSVPLPAVSTTDLAVAVRDRMLHIVGSMNDDQLLNKDFAAAISNGLKAQNTLDAREKVKAKSGQSLELVAGLRALLTGALAPPPQLEDGETFEGDYEDVTPE